MSIIMCPISEVAFIKTETNLRMSEDMQMGAGVLIFTWNSRKYTEGYSYC